MPSEDILKEFDFLDVDNMIVSAMTTIANQVASLKPCDMSFAIVLEITRENEEQIKIEIKKDLEVMETQVKIDAQMYADFIIDNLELILDAKFKAILDFVKSTENLFLEGTPTCKAFLHEKIDNFPILRDCHVSHFVTQT